MPQQMEEFIEFTGTGEEAYYSAHRSTMSEFVIDLCVGMCIRVFACICTYIYDVIRSFVCKCYHLYM